MHAETDKLRILFLSQRFLFPMDTGGKIRTGKILGQLSKMHHVTVISNVESPKDDPYLDGTDLFCNKFIRVPWVEVKRFTTAFYWKIFKYSFSRYPISMLNDYSSELENAVLTELENGKYDIAICDFMQSALNFKKVNNIPIMLFQHNVESVIAQRHMQRSKDPISKIFWWLQFRKMYYYEKKMCQRFDSVVAVSDADKTKMENWYGLKKVFTIPTGVDIEYFNENMGIKEKNQLVYVGAMDWLPNEDAVIFFLKDIFPLVKGHIPDVNLKIVGRNPSPKLEKVITGHKNVELTGWVEDTRPYIAESAVFIVPIRIGGGTRMKIYQAMAMSKAVVSTSIGAEGLPLENDKHIIFADDNKSFANSIMTLLNNAEKRKKIGETARQYVYENFRWENVAKVFIDICKETVLSARKNHS